MFRPDVTILSFCSDCGALLLSREFPNCDNCGQDCAERNKRLEGKFNSGEARAMKTISFGEYTVDTTEDPR